MTEKPELSGEGLANAVIDVLDERKGRNIRCLDVTPLTDITDFMVIVSGTSNRHVRALVEFLLTHAKDRGVPVLGVEGRETHEWVLIDLGDVIVHAMQDEARAFYDLERLWSDAPHGSESRV